MTSQTGLSGLPAPDESNTRTSSVPLLGEGFSENNTRTVSDSTGSDWEQDPANTQELDSKTGKRRFWGLGKKKDESKVKGKPEAAMASASNSTAVPELGPQSISSLESPRRTIVASPSIPTSHPYGTPPDTGRKMSSGSPHIPSPASSQIFERSVQDDGLATSASPAIPSHITTENHIPPVLDASSAAITDDHLNPDKVEIIMHAAHQPVAVTVTGGSSVADPTASSQDEPLAYTENDDTASNYGALDAADVRRLSFISFADVVHAEHVADHASGRESIMPSGAASIAPLGPKHRSPSPIRSPLSSLAYGTSPPVGESASPSQNLDTSPHRGVRNLGSPFPGHSPPPTGGELTIETMRQALRKTGSGDLSGARSQPISAVGGEDGGTEYSLK